MGNAARNPCSLHLPGRPCDREASTQDPRVNVSRVNITLSNYLFSDTHKDISGWSAKSVVVWAYAVIRQASSMSPLKNVRVGGYS